MSQPSDSKVLSWRIPSESDSLSLRARLVRTLLAGTICLALLFLLGTREQWWLGLAASIPIAVLAALVVWRLSQRRRALENNVWLDNAGLHWGDGSSNNGAIGRAQAEGFRIGLDAETVRAIPALTLILAGGFESQPVELHAPATPAGIRQLLTDGWGLREEAATDELAGARLRDSLLAHCQRDPATELQLLRGALTEPVRQPSGRWSIGCFPPNCQLSYEPISCSFTVTNGTDEKLELAGIEQLAAYIHESVLPRDGRTRRQLLVDIERARQCRELERLRCDACDAGFFAECVAAGHWLIEGPRAGLLAFCDRLDEAAFSLSAAPVGARPARLQVGGAVMRLAIQRTERAWLDEGTISGPPTFLRELAERTRAAIRVAQVDDEVSVAALTEGRSSWTFHLLVKADNWDPADCFR